MGDRIIVALAFLIAGIGLVALLLHMLGVDVG